MSLAERAVHAEYLDDDYVAIDITERYLRALLLDTQ
jgi:hypothetical protein